MSQAGDSPNLNVVFLPSVKETKNEKIKVNNLITGYELIFDKEKMSRHYQRVMDYRNATDKKVKDEIKENVFAVSPSVLKYDGKGTRQENIVERTNWMVIDIDNVDKVEEKKDELIEKFGTYCGVITTSISGRGIHMIVYIKHPDQYERHWAAFAEDVKREVGLTVDHNAKDVGRKLFIGYCESPFFNDIPEVYEKTATPILSPEIVKEKPASSESNIVVLKSIESQLRKMGEEFITGQRNSFILKFASFANHHGIPLSEAQSYLQDTHEIDQYLEHLKTLGYIYRTKQSEFGTKRFEVNTKARQNTLEGLSATLVHDILAAINKYYILTPKK